MWRITRDHLEGTDRTIQGGMTVDGDPLPNEGRLTTFRLYDDDGELYFSGELTDDDECLNQDSALSWGMYDSGCTTIKVRRGNAWIQDIG